LTLVFAARRTRYLRPAAPGVIAAAAHAPWSACAVYTAKAMLDGKGNDVWEMPVENVS
jgi:hypothetical protein